MDIQATVSQADWPKQEDWPKAGWKHALNAWNFQVGSVFGWNDGGHLWSGIVEEIDGNAARVKVKDILPAKRC